MILHPFIIIDDEEYFLIDFITLASKPVNIFRVPDVSSERHNLTYISLGYRLG